MKAEQAIETQGICYALLRLKQKCHQLAHHQHELIWYPETALTLVECIMYRPYVQSIVTESPWLIGCYDREEVRVWDTKRKYWRTPDIQTYGAAQDYILRSILGINQSLSSTPMDGGKSMKSFVKKLEKSY